MRLPRVTIITPSYNQAEFLEETIRSVLDQEYPNLEYMVVDGGSTDGSVEIIRRYADRLAWWVSERDHGQAEAINKGFARATGDVIAWVNSDDLQRPGAIIAAVNALRDHPDAALVYGDVLSIDAGGNPINMMRFAPYTLDDLMAFRIISQPGVFMRREALEAAGTLDERFHFMLDHHLWLRVAQHGTLVYLPQVMACARFHAGAKNIAQAPRFGEEALLVAAWMEQDAALCGRACQNRKHMWSGAYRVNGWYLVEGGRPGAALKSYWHSLRLEPGMALQDWKRMVYAVLSLLGLQRLKSTFYKLRGALRKRTQPDIYAAKREQ